MQHLLIAESSYLRIKAALAAMEEARDVVVTTLSPDGELRTVDQPAESVGPDINMLRLDWDLLQSGQMPKVLELVARASDLQFVQTSAAGLDHPLFKRVVTKAGKFCNSDAQAPAIAEFVVASVLNRWQRFDLRAARQAEKAWQGNEFREMIGSHWLLIGFGNICQRIARQVQGFEAKVTTLRRNQSAHDLADRVDSLDQLSRYLPDADVVVLGCALNDATRGLVDAAFLRQMNRDAVLVNISRGGVVNEGDLLAAVDQDLIDYAVLDVFEQEPLPADSPFWHQERVQVTPHASNRGLGTGKRGDALFLDNLYRYLTGKPLRNLVDPTSM